MRPLLRALVGGSLLAGLGCQPSDPGSELGSRLDQIDQRLTSIESTLQTVSEWTTAQTAKEQQLEAERKAKLADIEARRVAKEAQREVARTERAERRRSLLGGEDGAFLGELDAPEPSDREIEGAAEGIQCTEPAPERIECTIDRAFIDDLMSHPSQLARQARVVPRLVDGETSGFKLYGIRRGSLPKLLGLKNGDAIVRVDGKELSDVDAAMEAYTALPKAERFVVELERKGLPIALAIEIIE
ncbi:MAG: hypothetical protein AB1Z98_29430 [Nannocystaceae bacterium]